MKYMCHHPIIRRYKSCQLINLNLPDLHDLDKVLLSYYISEWWKIDATKIKENKMRILRFWNITVDGLTQEKSPWKSSFQEEDLK